MLQNVIHLFLHRLKDIFSTSPTQSIALLTTADDTIVTILQN